MKYFVALLFLLSLPSTVFGNKFTNIELGDITLEYVTYPVGSDIYELKVGISNFSNTLSDISYDYNAITGINGVFFCPSDYPQCGGRNYTINERFLDGQDHSFYEDTGERVVFGWNEDTIPFLFQTDKINPGSRDLIYEGLGNFPVIFSDGKNTLEYYHDIGLYDSKMKANLPRHFICSNKEKTEILFGRTSSASLDEIAPKLFEIGCWDALNLDAGSSAHLNYNGRELIKGARQIIDGLFISHKDINVPEIHLKIDIIMKDIEKYYSRLSYNLAIKKLDFFDAYITQLRRTIYDKYSITTYHSGNENGYILDIDDTHDLRQVLTLNTLQIKLRELRNKLD